MSNIRVEDLQRITQSQLNTGILFYISNSGIPYGTSLGDISTQIAGASGNFVTNPQLTSTSGSLSNQTNSTGSYLFNLINGNPNGYLTSGQSTGLYYPLKTNPLQYLTTSGDGFGLTHVTGLIFFDDYIYVSTILDTQKRSLWDGTEISLDWAGRVLHESSGNVVLDWDNKKFTTGWQALSFSIFDNVRNFNPLNFSTNSGWSLKSLYPNGNAVIQFYDLNNSGTMPYISGFNLINCIGITGSTGGAAPTIPFDFGYVNINSGNYNSQFIQFHQNFLNAPNVYGNIINNSGDGLIAFNISGISISGFYLNFSDLINTNNYYFDYVATTGLGLFNFALSALVSQSNVTTAGQGTITGVGSNGYIPMFTKDGSGIINSVISGDSTGIYISSGLTVSKIIVPNANFRIKDNQIQFWDIVANSGDPTHPWRALGVYSGATIWSDPIAD